VTSDEAFADGLVEVQDEGSQLIALACEPAQRADGRPVRGAGGKALALAAANRLRGSSPATPAGRAWRSSGRGPSGPEQRSRPACSISRARPRAG
jgi:hypothetical protein